jgi:hypothetical protein
MNLSLWYFLLFLLSPVPVNKKKEEIKKRREKKSVS